MKKILSLIIAVFSLSALSAFSPEDIHSFTLENGMRIFVLSDMTAAPVRFELAIGAGYSAQTERTAGFFPLYARLLGAEISADTVRIIRTVAPQESEYAVMELTSCLKPLASHTLSDTALRAALNQMKTEVTEYAGSTAGFINTAIDARMFPDAPWKVESGVYPALFGSTTVSSARSILNDIGAKYYTPQNTILYVSGNITVQAAYALAQKYFGDFKKNAVSDTKEAAVSPTSQRKFVLTDDDFSADITQIVLQYNHISLDEADCAAAVLNNDYGTYKKRLIAEKSLAILGAEYVNVASAQRFGSSRLIIQSLMEKTKASPCTQAETFLHLTQADDILTTEELHFALNRINAEFKNRADDSSALMELLSGWTALVPADNVTSLFSRSQRLSATISASLLESFLHTQKPFVFVLVNSKRYAACAKEFQKAGYQVITRKNGSWYTQELYKKTLAQKQTEPQKKSDNLQETDIFSAAKRFIAENKAHFSSFTLANDIPVAIKRTPGAKTTAFALTIRGGELLFAKESPGLCSVLTDSLAVNIRRNLDTRAAHGSITGDTNVRAKTYASCSVLTVTCATEEAPECARAIAEALIYGDITPAMADGVTYDERTQWRIKSGAATFQLLCSAMRTLYAKEPYANLFDDTKDKPVQTDFTRIAAAYPTLLDSSRFSLIVAGGISNSDALKTTLEQTFGSLNTQKETASIDATVLQPKMPRRIKRIQLRHLFLTDVSADKAGPRPAVLVPTKNFSDPALYCIPSPDLSATDIALFNALLYEIAARMQSKLEAEITMRTDVADYDFPFARLYAQNIKQISKIDAAYKETISELAEDLQSLVNAETSGVINTEKDRLLATMENRWLMNTLSATGTALGTAELMQTGATYGNPALYLDQYAAIDTAKPEDYFILMQFYFSDLPDFRVYSIDSKK